MPKKYNPKQTYEKILAVSEELFLTKGFDKTSMQDIVNALGMSKGAIFHHFKSKEDIFDAIFAKTAKQQVDEYENVWSSELSGLNAREKLAVLLSRSLVANYRAATMMAMRINDPKIIVGLMRNAISVSAPIFADIIKEGNSDGSIETDYPDEAAQVILILLNTWCDPVIFECDIACLVKRLKFIQHLARSIGIDIISDEHIERNIEFTRQLYGHGDTPMAPKDG